MESNGKYITRSGKAVNYSTGMYNIQIIQIFD